MTNDNRINISRRKVLAGLGTIGLASAGAGLGTSAYFSDREDFEDNTLVAGELDLKVDWQQSYYRGLEGQDPDDHRTWERINAYPDANGDKKQDVLYTREQVQIDPAGTLGLDANATAAEIEEAYRDQFADLPDDFEMPVIELLDVKPGDMGEITVSMHLFDNPGYIWLAGELTENAENGVNEPESKDPDEDDNANGEDPNAGDMWSGELADELMVRLWYDDDCDNSLDNENPPCIHFVIDDSDSMQSTAGGSMAKNVAVEDAITTYVDALEDFDTADDNDLSPSSVGITLFSSPDTGTLAPTSDKSDVLTKLSDLTNGDAGGNTDVADGITNAANELGSMTDCERVMVVITNGIAIDSVEAYTAAQQAVIDGKVDRIVTIGVATEDQNARDTLQDIADLTPTGAFIDTSSPDDIDDAINGPATSLVSVVGTGQGVGGETIFAEGTLNQVFAGVNPDGSAYGGQSITVPEGIPLDADRETEGRQCYPNSTTRCFAMKWWLPVGVANEIQTDSVKFAMRLYAEQCRHNDGSNAEPFDTPSA
ncbi:MAG: VWA domain-containing protein [Halobacteriota archaeon]